MSYIQDRFEDGVLELTLNRPDHLNALNRDLLLELDEWIHSIASRDAVRVLMITGAGPKAFCAGADIEGLQGLSEQQAYEFMRFGQAVFSRLEKLPIPVIAAVNGYALGGGCELMMACDIRFASNNAKMGQPEINLANVPGWGGTQRLPRIVGVAKAKEMILSGNLIDAQAALHWGLVNEVYDADTLSAKTHEFALSVAGKSIAAVRLAKQVIDGGIERGLDYGLEQEARAVGYCCTTEAQHQAVANFISKRARK